MYYLRGDHLGTATFVTNSSGKATQFFLNLSFGETMLEQMDGSYNNPYKFNAKELDEDTGLYYYGARYYNPRLSIWYGVDSLAIYNPVMETQFYGDGQHNGGVYFWGNLNPYIYTYQSPINLIDPNGKQAASKAYRGGGYRGIGIPIPMYERGNIRTPFPVHTQEEYREGFNKLGDGLKAATVMGLTAVAASTSDVWVPLIDKYKQAINWLNRVLNSNNDSEFAPTGNTEINKEII
ncbi:MAG: RHS repeat domain-containing protein [Chryseobacterium jejuense]|uniref:RHS repeat domain-containing protein n=1 Tax=Chryseobacterium jejuense TaxID=445960 RepID=UPI003D0FD069